MKGFLFGRKRSKQRMRLTTKQSEQSAEAKRKEFLSSQYVKLAYAECSYDFGEGCGVSSLEGGR